jgi:GAF domain-containing protein/HAMP domain-containing protein
MNNPSTHPQKEEARRERNALAVSVTTGILFLVISIILGSIGYFENGLNGLWGVGVTGLVSLAAFLSALQVSRGRAIPGITMLIVTILVLACILPFIARGQGLALAIIVLILVAGIASVSLPPAWTRVAIISAFVIAIFVVLTDLYLPYTGQPANPIYTNVAAGVTSFVYALFILRNFRSYSLQTKIIIAFIVVTIFPLFLLSFINSRFTIRTIQAQNETQLSSLAIITADTVDDFIITQLDNVYADAKQVSLTEYLEDPAFEQAEQKASLTLLALTRKSPIFIRSAAVLNTNGINILDSFEKNQGRNEADFPYFTRPLKNGLPYVSNITFRGNKPSIFFSAPIKNAEGKNIGILRIEYHAAVIQSFVQNLQQKDSDTIISLVDTNTYLRTAHTGNRDNLFKSYKAFTEVELVALESDGRLPLDPLRETNNAIVEGINNLQQESLFYLFSDANVATDVHTGVFLSTQPWVALVSQPTNEYLAPLREQQRTNALISVLLVIFSVVTGFIVSQVLTSPLTALTKIAEKVTSGDLTAQAEIRTEDEIGVLADTFNRMTSQLYQMLTGLEQKIAERTTDLELSRQQSIKRANELQSISEISKIITGEQKLENLLPLITRLVSENFNFYHTGIFLMDKTNQFAVLQAANSDGGRNMLKRGHKLEVGESGIVGYVAKSGLPRISLDVGQDAVYFNNPDLPNTRSEMALPLKVRDRTVGVLDVQSERPGAFTENDANTLSILADQIAIALENAQLFSQTQQALSEAQALYRQNLQEDWKTFSREREFLGYQQSLTSGKRLEQTVDTDEIRQAINRGEVLIFHEDGITQEASMVVPIKLRGQIIGNMNIKAPVKNRKWSNDEVNLAEVISERLSIALENARLIQESQRQAIKEQTISEVTGKIGASINLKNVLQTAVEELGRAMPGSEVIIKFEEND